MESSAFSAFPRGIIPRCPIPLLPLILQVGFRPLGQEHRPLRRERGACALETRGGAGGAFTGV